MLQTKSATLQERCRLVGALTELSATKLSKTDYNLADRLGHLIGVSGSMTLARGLRALPELESRPERAQQTLRQDLQQRDLQQQDLQPQKVQPQIQLYVLSERKRVIRSIIDSFSLNDGDAPTRVPSLASGVRAEALKSFEPYQRFYITHQMELAVAVRGMRDRVRVSASSTAPELAQLVELDRMLDESLEAQTRKLFAVMPKLLNQRFNQIRADAGRANGGNDELSWVLPFHDDMRELLLAELDVRLQPVFGLLEAIDEYS